MSTNSKQAYKSIAEKIHLLEDMGKLRVRLAMNQPDNGDQFYEATLKTTRGIFWSSKLSKNKAALHVHEQVERVLWAEVNKNF